MQGRKLGAPPGSAALTLFTPTVSEVFNRSFLPPIADRTLPKIAY